MKINEHTRIAGAYWLTFCEEEDHTMEEEDEEQEDAHARTEDN